MALINHITGSNSIEINKIFVGVYLDLAFDTVEHQILIRKLKEVRFEGPLLNWCTTYLQSRKQLVKIGETLSDNIQITNIGVPHRGVLSAIFFLIYINNLHYLQTRAKILGYADDTSLFYSEETPAEIEEAFKRDMDIILPWFIENLLHLNLGKNAAS